MLKVYFCLVAGLLGLCVSAQELPPGTNASPPGVTNASPTAPPGAALSGLEEVVWIEDGTPAGASLSAAPDDPWVWTNAFWDGRELVGPYSGSLMHLSPLSAGWHRHFFTLPGPSLVVDPADSLFAYVCLPLSNAPATVMLEWLASDTNGSVSGSWGHRAFWGGQNILTNSSDTNTFYAGPLPAAGQWARLSAPAGAVGLQALLVQGISFGLDGGTAAWDRAGRLVVDPGTNGLSSGQGEPGAGPFNQSPSCVAPPAGLVGWWRGEGNCSDLENRDNGTSQGGLTYGTGEVGQCFGLNGSDADVLVPASATLNVGTNGSFTVEGWINALDLSNRPIVEWNNPNHTPP